MWGYFSDKLSIPVARLSKNNIEGRTVGTGVEDELVGTMQILDTCEFARLRPRGEPRGDGPVYRDPGSDWRNGKQVEVEEK